MVILVFTLVTSPLDLLSTLELTLVLASLVEAATVETLAMVDKVVAQHCTLAQTCGYRTTDKSGAVAAEVAVVTTAPALVPITTTTDVVRTATDKDKVTTTTLPVAAEVVEAAVSLLDQVVTVLPMAATTVAATVAVVKDVVLMAVDAVETLETVDLVVTAAATVRMEHISMATATYIHG